MISIEFLDEEYRDLQNWLLDKLNHRKEQLIEIMNWILTMQKKYSEEEYWAGLWLGVHSDGAGYKVEIHFTAKKMPWLSLTTHDNCLFGFVQIPPFRCFGLKDWKMGKVTLWKAFKK